MLQNFFSVIKAYPSVAFYVLARVLTGSALQIVTVVVGWYIYAQTQSVMQLGLIGLTQFFPIVLLTLPAGHVADNYPRRYVAMVCQTVAACVAGFLAFYSWMEWDYLPAIYAAVMLLSVCRSFEGPASAPILASLVPAHLMPRASAVASSSLQTAMIMGPALGGLLYLAGPAVAYAVVVVFYLCACVLMGLITVHHQTRERNAVTLTSLFSGFVHIWKKRMIFGAISLDMFAVLLGGATALLPVYAHDILHTGPVGLGILRAAPSIGALLMSAYLAYRPLKGQAGHTMFMAVIAFGVFTIIFGLSTNIYLSIAALMLMGAADVISVVIRWTLVQLGTPDALRGRVSAVNYMFIGTSNQLGEFESGATAALFGTVPAVVLGGFGTIAVALGWMRLFPELTAIDRLEDIKH